MTPEYPRNTSWQVRIIQVFVVVLGIVLSFVALTSIARNLASGISNETTAEVTIQEGLDAMGLAPWRGLPATGRTLNSSVEGEGPDPVVVSALAEGPMAGTSAGACRGT